MERREKKAKPMNEIESEGKEDEWNGYKRKENGKESNGKERK